MRDIWDLLAELACDFTLRELLLREPLAAARRAGWSDAELSAIVRASALQGGAAGVDGWERCTIFVDPGEDPQPNPDPLPGVLALH